MGSKEDRVQREWGGWTQEQHAQFAMDRVRRDCRPLSHDRRALADEILYLRGELADAEEKIAFDAQRRTDQRIIKAGLL